MIKSNEEKAKKKENELSKGSTLLVSKFNNFLSDVHSCCPLFTCTLFYRHFISYVWLFCNNSSDYGMAHRIVFDSLMVALKRTHSSTSNRVCKGGRTIEDSSTAFAMSIHCVSSVHVSIAMEKKRKENELEIR